MTIVNARLDCVEKIAPLIRNHAEEGENARRLSAPVVAAMVEAGLW